MHTDNYFKKYIGKCKKCWNSSSSYDEIKDFTYCTCGGHKWDLRFLELSRFISSWSKDSSTKCGAVIVENNTKIVSIGYNGFAEGVIDNVERYENRDYKINAIAHAEINAILFSGRSVKNCTLYTYPFQACLQCSTYVINAGITRCVAPFMPEDKKERWKDNMDKAAIQFKEANVELEFVDFK